MTKDITDVENVAPWIEMFITTWMRDQLQQDADLESALAPLGVESPQAVRFMDDLAAFVGLRDLPVQLLLEHPTTADLAHYLAMLVTGSHQATTE